MDLKQGHIQLIIDTAKEQGLLRNQLAYVLATVKHETNGTFLPVREAYWVPNAKEWRKKNLRYYPWYGRGFVQLTWDYNYRRAGTALGVNFMANPDLVMDPVYSAKILILGSKEGWFTGKKLSDYITLTRSDFVGARRIINGTDKAETIASYARTYDNELKAMGYGSVVVDVPQEPVQEVPPLVTTDVPAQDENVSVTLPRSFVNSLIDMLTKLITALKSIL